MFKEDLKSIRDIHLQCNLHPKCEVIYTQYSLEIHKTSPLIKIIIIENNKFKNEYEKSIWSAIYEESIVKYFQAATPVLFVDERFVPLVLIRISACISRSFVCIRLSCVYVAHVRPSLVFSERGVEFQSRASHRD